MEEKISNKPKVLIILGNGYDRHRGCNSSYQHLKELIEKTLDEEFVTKKEFIKFLLENNSTYIFEKLYDQNKDFKTIIDKIPGTFYYQSIQIYEKRILIEELYDNPEIIQSITIKELVEALIKFDKILDILDFFKENYEGSEKSILMYHIIFSYYSNKSYKNTEDIRWGDIEAILLDVHKETKFEPYKDIMAEKFIVFKKFIENEFVNYIKKSGVIDRILSNNSYCEDIACVDFNYTESLRNSFTKNNYFSYHGKPGKGIIFGTNIPLSDSMDKFKLAIDKKMQKIKISSTDDMYDDLDISNAREVFTLGFGFSRNDEYFIHALLHNNPNLKFTIISLSSEADDKYAIDQMQNLYRTLSNYKHDEKLLEKKIVANDFKIQKLNPDLIKSLKIYRK